MPAGRFSFNPWLSPTLDSRVLLSVLGVAADFPSPTRSDRIEAYGGGMPLPDRPAAPPQCYGEYVWDLCTTLTVCSQKSAPTGHSFTYEAVKWGTSGGQNG